SVSIVSVVAVNPCSMIRIVNSSAIALPPQLLPLEHIDAQLKSLDVFYKKNLIITVLSDNLMIKWNKFKKILGGKYENPTKIHGRNCRFCCFLERVRIYGFIR